MSSEGLFLDAAAAIGRSIVADAAWHNGYCSWMGAVTRAIRINGRGVSRARPESLRGDRGRWTLPCPDRQRDRRQIIPAYRSWRAPSRHGTGRQSPVSRRDGFHAGSVGVAWAAARAALLLEEEEMHARAVALSTQLDVPSGPDRCPDLITGMAGSALGLLALADELGDPRLVEQARRDGRDPHQPRDRHVTRMVVGHPRQALSRAPMRHLPRRSRNRVGAARAIRSHRR